MFDATVKEYMPWSEDLSVGLQEIDEQHKALVALVNHLFNEAILKKADKSVIRNILVELVQYTVIHFSVEESLFRIFDYPETEIHQKQHEKLKEDVLDFQKKFEMGIEVDIELMNFLRKWLKDHIMLSDKKFTPYFFKMGLKSGQNRQRSWAKKILDLIGMK